MLWIYANKTYRREGGRRKDREREGGVEGSAWGEGGGKSVSC